MEASKLDKTSSVFPDSYDAREECRGNVSEENTPLIVVRSSGFKCRHCIAMMGFAICFYFSASRINMSVTIVDMVNNSASAFDVDGKSESCPGLIVNLTHRKYIQRADQFKWSPAIQGYILGCYYLIYIFMQIPFGKLVEKHGCKRFLVLGTMVDATGTLVIPTASRLHPYALIAVQVVRGAAQGTYIASVTLLAANWFPKTERGLLFTSVLSGFSIGTFCGSVLSGFLCQSSALGGWPSAFYVYGFTALLLSGAIGFFIHNNPSSHPRITPEELAYILSNQENQDLSQERPNPPWTEIFKSAPVHALTVAYFEQNWAISQFLLVQSTFLGTILHYPIDQNGFYSAVPFLFMFLCTQMSSGLSALMINKMCASVNFTRKFWNFVACSGFSACLLGVYFAGCNRLLSIVFSVLSVGFIGFGESGSLIASTDMSPKFAASLNAFCNVMGVMPCFILPLLVGYITNEMQTIEQWNKVFFISIGIVMTSGAVFSLFGSAEVQRWNFTEDERRPALT